MPIPATTGEIYEMVVEGRQEGQQVLNVMHFRMKTDVDDIILRLAEAWVQCMVLHLIPVMGSNFQLVMVRLKRVSPTLGAVIEYIPPAGMDVQGEASGDTEPSFVSVHVGIRSLRGGRSGLGGFFIPGVPEGATSGSYIETTNPYWVAILAFVACVAGKFIHATEALGLNMIDIGVMSRKIGGAKPPYLAAGFSPAFMLKPSNILSHNVSRKVKRGS